MTKRPPRTKKLTPAQAKWLTVYATDGVWPRNRAGIFSTFASLESLGLLQLTPVHGPTGDYPAALREITLAGHEALKVHNLRCWMTTFLNSPTTA